MSGGIINFPDRQLPEGGEVFLDHVAWMTTDMDRASAVFERLGFVLTPYSVHGNRDKATGALTVQGSANRLAMLDRGYVEILAAVAGAETPVAANIRQSLGRYEGVHLIAFTVADAAAAHARLEAAGPPMQPLVNLRRDVEAADGSADEVAFSVVRPAFGAFPEGRLQLLTHHRPDLMWQDRYITRANRIEALTEVVICIEEPGAAASRLAELVDRRPSLLADGAWAVDLDRGCVSYVAPEGLAARAPGVAPPGLPYVAALGLRSADLDVTAAYFRSRGVAYQTTPAGLLVAPTEALGCALVLHG